MTLWDAARRLCPAFRMTQVALGRSNREVMFGRYRLLGRIAAGGMAEVWAAQLLAAGGFCKSMVIKRVLPELASNPSFLRMLMTEARVAARLSHANICSVFELGEVEGEYYIAMEYLRGAPLTTLLREGGALPVPLAVSIVAQACEGLHYAHEQRDPNGNLLGLVHRDVSPHNLFVTVDGIVKVLDFGIAKVDDGLSDRTEAGKVKGKLAYMSPEQLSADRLDRRSDVWSIGAVLWELLTGRRLFGGGPAQLVDGIRHARVPTLASAGVDFPALDDVLARAICRKQWRYASAADLRTAMLAAIEPATPTPADGVAQLVWTRCGGSIRAQDRRFESVESGAAELDVDVVDRLPLRAKETQASHEMYILEGDPGQGSIEMLGASPEEPGKPAGKPRRYRPPTADTSPEVPAALPQDSGSLSSGSLIVAARASAVTGGTDPDISGPMRRVAVTGGTDPDIRLRPRGGRKAVFGLLVAAMIVGVAIGVVLHNRRTATDADEATARVEEATTTASTTTAPVVTPQPERAADAATTEPAKAAAAPQHVALASRDADEPRPAAEVKNRSDRKKAERAKKTARPKLEVVEPKKIAEPKKVAKVDPGKLYVDAKPWATIYVDGKKVGATPVLGATIAAGDHVIKAVCDDGRVKSMTVHVDAGGTVRKKVNW